MKMSYIRVFDTSANASDAWLVLSSVKHVCRAKQRYKNVQLDYILIDFTDIIFTLIKFNPLTCCAGLALLYRLCENVRCWQPVV